MDSIFVHHGVSRALREALGDLFAQYSQARRHNFRQALLVLDVDLSPLPASRRAEGAERAYMPTNCAMRL